MPRPIKPPALAPDGILRVISPAFPTDSDALARGVAELERCGYGVRLAPPKKKANIQPDGYFAAPLAHRTAELKNALHDSEADAIICARGGYGSSALLDNLRIPRSVRPKLLIGYSDVTALQVYLWQRLRWTSLYAPMVGAGWNNGAGKPHGYDYASFLHAASGTRQKWSIALNGESFTRGDASGVLLGGCLTLVETTLGTPWELDTRGAILLLEDRGVRPYQVDRMLLHLAQAGKLRGVRGFVLGDFPESDPPHGSRVTVRDVCRRILGALRVPVVFGAPVGHTSRPMLTLPLGVRARLRADGEGKLEILEPAVALRK